MKWIFPNNTRKISISLYICISIFYVKPDRKKKPHKTLLLQFQRHAYKMHTFSSSLSSMEKDIVSNANI